MADGIVKWFDDRKGYGFIESAEHDSDIFLHHSQFVNDEYIHEGSHVTFETEGGEKGLKAKAVALKKII